MKIIRNGSICSALLILFMMTSCNQYAVYPTKTRTQNYIEGGVVYALPKTVVRVEVVFEKTDFSVSPYAEYAEELLGFDIGEAEQWYRIEDISITAINKPDPEHYYYIDPGCSNVSVCLNDDGLLRSINSQTPLERKERTKTVKIEKMSKINLTDILYETTEYENDTDEENEESQDLIKTEQPKVIEKTLKQRAIEAAEILKELRSKKKEILYGEYESNYDPKMLNAIYEQLEIQENRYMQLFVGVKSRITEIFYIEPEMAKVVVDDQTVELFRYTHEKSIVDSSEVGAIPVYCNLRSENNLYLVNKFVKNKPNSKFGNRKYHPKTFRYRIPEIVTVSVVTPDFTCQQQVKVAQYGPIMELPRRYLEAIFDDETGELIYYKNKK